MIPAAAGWRVVLLDRENDGAVALPVVGWVWRRADPDAEDYSKVDYGGLEPFFMSHDRSSIVRLGPRDVLLGYAAPGEDGPDAMAWDEIARQELDAREERESRSGRPE